MDSESGVSKLRAKASMVYLNATSKALLKDRMAEIAEARVTCPSDDVERSHMTFHTKVNTY